MFLPRETEKTSFIKSVQMLFSNTQYAQNNFDFIWMMPHDIYCTVPLFNMKTVWEQTMFAQKTIRILA